MDEMGEKGENIYIVVINSKIYTNAFGIAFLNAENMGFVAIYL